MIHLWDMNYCGTACSSKSIIGTGYSRVPPPEALLVCSHESSAVLGTCFPPPPSIKPQRFVLYDSGYWTLDSGPDSRLLFAPFSASLETFDHHHPRGPSPTRTSGRGETCPRCANRIPSTSKSLHMQLPHQNITLDA